MRPATLILTGVPQFVKLYDLSRRLDLLFDTDDIGTFEIRAVLDYHGRRKIALDFSSTFDAFTAQGRLDGYVYELPDGQECMLIAKLSKERNMPLPTNCNRSRWRRHSNSPAAAESEDWNAVAVMPRTAEGMLEQAHAKLDAQLDLLRKQKRVLRAQTKVLRAKKKLEKEYSKAIIDSNVEPSSRFNLVRDLSRSMSRESQPSPLKNSETPPLKTKVKKIKQSESTKELTKHPSRSNNRRSRWGPPQSPSEDQRSSSIERRSISKNQRSGSRTRSSQTPAKRQRSLSKNLEAHSKNRRSSSTIRRSRSKSRRSESKNLETPSKNRRSSSIIRRRLKSKNLVTPSKNRRSVSKNLESASENPKSRSIIHTRNCRSRSRKPSWSKHHKLHSNSKKRRSRSRSKLRASRSKYRRSRSRQVKKRRRSSSRGSRDDCPRYARLRATRTLWSPEYYRSRSRSRDRRERHSYRARRLCRRDSSSRSPSYESYTRQLALAIMPPAPPIQDPHSIIIQRTNAPATVSDYYSDYRVTDYYDGEQSTCRGMRYVSEVDKGENASKCIDLDTNNDVMPSILTYVDKNRSYSKEITKEINGFIGQANEVANNITVDKPLVEILLQLCKDPIGSNNLSSNNDAIGSNQEKVPASPVVHACQPVSNTYLDSKTHVPEAPNKGNIKVDGNNLDLRETRTIDKNEEDIKPIIDSEKITGVIENKDGITTLVHAPNIEGAHFGDDVKPVIDTGTGELIAIKKKMKTRPLPKRPKFVIIIRKLMKEMEASLKKAKQDHTKMSFQCKFMYVLRCILKEIVLGKDYMPKSEIMGIFRENHPKEKDDEFASQVVADIQAGKYGNLGPSGDELSDGHVSDDIVLVEAKHDIIVIPDSDDDSEKSQKINENVCNKSVAWAAWARTRCLTAKTPNKTQAPRAMMPRVLIPYPANMGSQQSPQPDNGNTHQETEVKADNDIVPEFTDTELENLLGCMETAGNTDLADGIETPHVTGITIMTSLSELCSLKYGLNDTKKEKEIKIEPDSLTEEYMNDDAQYYNPY